MKNNRRALIAGLAVILVALLVALVVYDRIHPPSQEQEAISDPPAPDPLQIAVILNLSGSAAQFDAIKAKTVEIAEKRVSEIYPDLDITVRLYDAAGGPQGTASAVSNARRDGALFYLSGTSPTALAIANEVRSLRPLPIQMANAANPDFGPPRPGEYRLWPDWGQEASVLVSLVQERAWQRLVVIHSADPYSTALYTAFSKRLAESGVTVVGTTSFDPADAPDFRPLLLKGRAEEADVVVVFGLPPGIRSLIAQMAEVGWTGAVVGGVNINLASNEYAGSGLDGGLWLIRTEAMEVAMPAGSEAAAFREVFETTYGSTPPFHALYIADALYFIAEAYSGGCNGSPVECVGQVKAFEGASGHVDVRADGVLEFRMNSERAK